MDTVKRCSRCNEEKPLEQFSRDKRRPDGRFPWCKTCKSASDKDHYERNREQRLVTMRVYKKAHPEFSRRWHEENRESANQRRLEHYYENQEFVWARNMWAKYRMTPEQYHELLDAQGGGCAICGAWHGEKRRLAVDHDHNTGKVRGILCHPCNSAIGLARDDSERLMKMVVYLQERADG